MVAFVQQIKVNASLRMSDKKRNETHVKHHKWQSIRFDENANEM